MNNKVKHNISLIEDEDKREIASLVAAALDFKKWNQSALSRRSGVSTGTISKIVNTGEASQVNIFKAFKALDLIRNMEKSKTARSGTCATRNDLLDKAAIVLNHGDRLSQVSLEKAILELYQAMESNPEATDVPLIEPGSGAGQNQKAG